MLANARMLMSGTAGSLTIVSGCDAANPDTPRVLGVHMVSQMASDIIAEAEQLVGNHVPLADAACLVHPHPTFSETLGEAAQGRRTAVTSHAETNQHKQVRTSAPDKMLSSVFRSQQREEVMAEKRREAEEAEHNQAASSRIYKRTRLRKTRPCRGLRPVLSLAAVVVTPIIGRPDCQVTWLRPDLHH